MTPRRQTVLDTGDPSAPGNCLQAAVASLLDLPLEDVPHFVQLEADGGGEAGWMDYLVEFARGRGQRLEPIYDTNPAASGEHYLLFGRTVRGTYHATVYIDGALAWDPHPSGAGLSEPGIGYALRPA